MGIYRFKSRFCGFNLRIAFSAFLLCLSFGLHGQTGVTVLDERLEPIKYANVALVDSDEFTVTDSLGRLSIPIDTPTKILIFPRGWESQIILLKPGQWITVIMPDGFVSLGSVRVEGFLDNRNKRLLDQAGGIARLKLPALQRFGENSLVQAINTVPGIRFEERAGASYRISIRGSSIRSPFGVRNVKVYWNGIPFTEPGGNTFINLLDLSNVGSVEIIKGPAASIYGAGNGGVIKLQSTALAGMTNSTAIGTSVGSFGFFRQTAMHNTSKDNSSLTVKFAHQQRDGYRDHNEMQRTVFELDGLFFPNENRTISTSFLFSDLEYQIPGGLNPDQRAENPRQPRAGSIERNASVDNQLFLARIGQEYTFASGLENRTNIGVSFNQFENPFNLDFKKDNQQIFSARTEFSKSLDFNIGDGEITYGTEYQSSFFDGKNFGNVAGQADTIRFADEVRVRQNTTFFNARLPLSKSIDVTAGISLNSLVYDIDRVVDRINNNPVSFKKEFDAVWSQCIAVSKQFGDNYALHLSFSNGFSPPTTTEVRTNDGNINAALQGEKGQNLELNFRGQPTQSFSFDLAVFNFRLEDAISTIVNRQGVQLFRNAGGTTQNGIELQLRNFWVYQPQGIIKSLSSNLAYTYHNFEYDSFIDNGDDFSGNALPGTAPHVLNLSTDLELTNGLYLNATYHYSDPIPLNDENTFFSRAYNLMNLRAGFKGNIKERTNFELFFGVENLFDVSYSLGNDLNAFGRRYFQPAPGINYYLGLKLKMNH